jgi:hypothetical protein
MASLPRDQVEFLWKWSRKTSIRKHDMSWTHQNIETYQSKLGGVTVSLQDKGMGISKIVFKNIGLTGVLPEELGACVDCQIIRIYGNEFDSQCTIPKSIDGRFGSLHELDLSDSGLEGTLPENLCFIPQLGDLNLSGNHLSGTLPAAMSRLAALRQLRLADNNLEGNICTGLEECHHLTLIDLTNNKGMAGTVPKKLANNRSLQLKLNGTKLNDLRDVSLYHPLYPLYLVSFESVLQLDRLPSHEELLSGRSASSSSSRSKSKPASKTLAILQSGEGEEASTKVPHIYRITRTHKPFQSFEMQRILPGGALDSKFVTCSREEMLFVSHQWLDGLHPDSERGDLLAHLQILARKEGDNQHAQQHATTAAKGQGDKLRTRWIWLDYMCTPQRFKMEEGRAGHAAACASLPFYINCCRRFMALVGTNDSGKLEAYHKRGWCLLEILCAVTPLAGAPPATSLSSAAGADGAIGRSKSKSSSSSSDHVASMLSKLRALVHSRAGITILTMPARSDDGSRHWHFYIAELMRMCLPLGLHSIPSHPTPCHAMLCHATPFHPIPSHCTGPVV